MVEPQLDIVGIAEFETLLGRLFNPYVGVQ